MPLHDYHCEHCGTVRELLTRHGDQCPTCDERGRVLAKVPARFSARVNGYCEANGYADPKPASATIQNHG